MPSKKRYRGGQPEVYHDIDDFTPMIVSVDSSNVNTVVSPEKSPYSLQDVNTGVSPGKSAYSLRVQRVVRQAEEEEEASSDGDFLSSSDEYQPESEEEYLESGSDLWEESDDSEPEEIKVEMDIGQKTHTQVCLEKGDNVMFPTKSRKSITTPEIPKKPDRMCVFCNKVIVGGKLKRHIMSHQDTHSEVKEILQQPVETQNKWFNQKRIEGIYQYNLKHLNLGDDKLMRERRPQKPDSLRMCNECKRFYSHRTFFRHKMQCGPKKDQQQEVSPSNVKKTKKQKPARMCVFCNKVIFGRKLRCHIISHQKTHSEVKEILQQPVETQNKWFNQKRIEGIYQYNLKHLDASDDQLMRERQSKKPNSLRMCTECKRFFSGKTFYRHKLQCGTRSQGLKKELLRPVGADMDENFVTEILHKFRDGEVGSLIRQNKIIQMFGYKQFLSSKIEDGIPNNLRQEIMNEMRTLAKLYLCFKALMEGSEVSVEDMYKQENLGVLKEAIKKRCCDENGEKHCLKLSLNSIFQRSIRNLTLFYEESKENLKVEKMKDFGDAYKLSEAEIIGDSKQVILENSLRKRSQRQSNDSQSEADSMCSNKRYKIGPPEVNTGSKETSKDTSKVNSEPNTKDSEEKLTSSPDVQPASIVRPSEEKQTENEVEEIHLKELRTSSGKSTGKKRPGRMCVFCKKVLNGGLKKHIKIHKKTHNEVREILQQPLETQNKWFNQKRIEGIYQYNLKHYQSDDDQLMRERRSKNPDSLRMCNKCRRFYSHRTFFRHKVHCGTQCEGLKKDLFKPSDGHMDEKFLTGILNKFRDGEVGNLIRQNKIIQMFGYKHFLSRKVESAIPSKFRNGIMTEMREITRLYLCFKALMEGSVVSVEDMYKQENLGVLKDALNKLCRDENGEKHGIKLVINAIFLRTIKRLTDFYKECGENSKVEETTKFGEEYKLSVSEIIAESQHQTQANMWKEEKRDVSSARVSFSWGQRNTAKINEDFKSWIRIDKGNPLPSKAELKAYLDKHSNIQCTLLQLRTKIMNEQNKRRRILSV
ncbi:uncharacterized protein LOC133195795 isoform X2 [Saccostrea echinata]|uniref:uncharacterized protein LOC133195795 isoform X2 n=1 Tax=Saccostrea echinata TaxID=191078 RepID=UPI002A81D374|nr:uncharacterized protein LOC133195795 isoform X2 [Saccostrea echinata]